MQQSAARGPRDPLRERAGAFRRAGNPPSHAAGCRALLAWAEAPRHLVQAPRSWHRRRARSHSCGRARAGGQATAKEHCRLRWPAPSLRLGAAPAPSSPSPRRALSRQVPALLARAPWPGRCQPHRWAGSGLCRSPEPARWRAADRAGWTPLASWSAPWLRGRGRHVFSMRSVYQGPLLLSSPGKNTGCDRTCRPGAQQSAQPHPARPWPRRRRRRGPHLRAPTRPQAGGGCRRLSSRSGGRSQAANSPSTCGAQVAHNSYRYLYGVLSRLPAVADGAPPPGPSRGPGLLRRRHRLPRRDWRDPGQGGTVSDPAIVDADGCTAPRSSECRDLLAVAHVKEEHR